MTFIGSVGPWTWDTTCGPGTPPRSPIIPRLSARNPGTSVPGLPRAPWVRTCTFRGPWVLSAFHWTAALGCPPAGFQLCAHQLCDPGLCPHSPSQGQNGGAGSTALTRPELSAPSCPRRGTAITRLICQLETGGPGGLCVMSQERTCLQSGLWLLVPHSQPLRRRMVHRMEVIRRTAPGLQGGHAACAKGGPQHQQERMCRPWGTRSWALILTGPPGSCATLGKFIHISEPVCSSVNKDRNSPAELNETMCRTDENSPRTQQCPVQAARSIAAAFLLL